MVHTHDIGREEKWKLSILCGAYRSDAQTERESWPLPNIEEVLDSLGGFEYYTMLDGFSGFNTIPSRRMTSISLPSALRGIRSVTQ